MFEVVGNSDHVEARDTYVKNGKKGAEKRWGKKDGQAIVEANSNSPDVKNSLPPRPPDPPHLSQGEGSRPRGDELSEYSVPVKDAAELIEHWQAEREERGESRVLIVPDAWLSSAKRVIAQARGLENAKRIVSAFVRSDHGWWAKAHWEFTLLDTPRDFLKAVMLVGGTPGGGDDREPLPWANGGKDWEAWHGRQQSRKAASQ